MENQIPRSGWSRIHGLFEPFWNIGELMAINYVIFGIITYLYFPLYGKQGLKYYNDRMVVFDAQILFGLPMIGALFVTMIVQKIIRIIKIYTQKKNE